MKQLEPDLPATEVEMSSQTYRDFKASFGQTDAEQVLAAGSHDRERPRLDDYFVDCLAVAIGYDCFTKFHDHHGFNHPTDVYTDWIKTHVDFSPYADVKSSCVVRFKKKFKEFL